MQVYHFVGRINSEFGAVARQAVYFLRVRWKSEDLSALFACGDVLLATSIREAFCWAAYAFILCQQYTNRGVLVLSEFSGSAQVYLFIYSSFLFYTLLLLLFSFIFLLLYLIQ